MPAITGRWAARVAVTIVVALLVSGCAGKTATSTAASTPSTTTTAAPTTTTVPPMTANELAWLKAVTALHNKIDKVFRQSGVTLTRAKMTSYANTLRGCGRELARIGPPSDRLQPVYAFVKQACAEYDKGAKCLATAAGVSDASGGVVASTAAARTQERAVNCGFEAQGNGSNLLVDAEAKAEEIKAEAG